MFSNMPWLPAMNLSELGEFGLIERIRKRVGEGSAVLGIGDDCAAYEVPAGELLLTSADLLLEGVHFRTAWSTFYDLGCKAVAVNVSDIAAMGGTPRAIFLSLAAPAALPVADLEELIAGVAEEAGAYGAELLGGDTSRSPGPLMLAITVQGSVPESELVSRSGARPGDRIWVSGSLGDSALALAELQGGRTPSDDLAGRHHRPQARLALGRALARKGLASAMIDVSDGLLSDLGHVLKASAAGAVVDVRRLPLSKSFRRHLEGQPQVLGLALQGGEDYELLFCSPPDRVAEVNALARELSLALTDIGEVRHQPGVELAGLPGELSLPRGGFDHFKAVATDQERADGA